MSLLNRLSGPRSADSTWSGYYLQNNKKRHFTATFVYSDNAIRGFILDQDPTSARQSLDMYLSGSPLSYQEAENYRQSVFQQLKCRDDETVYVVNQLCEKSTLEGDINDNFVSFVKRYDRGTVTTFSTERYRLRYTSKPHTVLYEGVLSEDGTQISGKWFLHNPESDTLEKGTFVMHRS